MSGIVQLRSLLEHRGTIVFWVNKEYVQMEEVSIEGDRLGLI